MFPSYPIVCAFISIPVEVERLLCIYHGVDKAGHDHKGDQYFGVLWDQLPHVTGSWSGRRSIGHVDVQVGMNPDCRSVWVDPVCPYIPICLAEFKFLSVPAALHSKFVGIAGQS
jgi:hypothetical protein